MATDKTPKPNIHQRMLAAMEDCGYIQKDGYNSFSKYKYVTHDATVEHVRPALVKNGILAIPKMLAVEWPEGVSTQGGKHNNLCRVNMQVTFINVDDPADYIAVELWGEAADTGDKAIFKAISGAKKYIFTNTFMLATGDDPEQDSPNYKQPKGDTKAQQPETGSDLEEARLAYSTLRENIGLSNAEMVKAFGGDLKKATADDILAFVAEMNCRHLFYQNVVQAVEQFKPSGPEFDELLEANGAASMAKSWHLVPSKNIMAVHEGIVARWDLPFDEPGSKG